ncbi:uncharacterized protein LOC126893283 [Diabrotica virgifera virgifera]|uniref:BED-type domain-containing protein n=1 Tax=Diabrotica virgifera virgifera TaxID=50390 RepID=A0ABM5L9Z4_DIAVI|nr:uncharacterized protein LOC126893283 [Diabrotica virgifera virgifera]
MKNDNDVEANCQLCFPIIKKISGSLNSSSNFIRHIKRVHPEKLEEYKRYKQSKRNSKLNKRCHTITDPEGPSTASTSASSHKQPRLMQTLLGSGNVRVDQANFEKRVVNFILEKIVRTITDNGSNFVKAFEQYHITNDEEEAINADDIFQVININEEKDTELLENDDMDVDSAEQFTLPKHFRCASHTLNLIATTDYKNLIKENAVLRKRHTAAFQKCNLLWNKANRPKSNEIIQNILGHTLSRPGITRWNSLYDSVKQILKEKVKLNTLFKKLELEPFKGTELLFLEDYCMVMEPLAHTLDFLQGEHANNSFFGFLLPSLLSLINKYEKKSSGPYHIQIWR